jgi:hypothetical protein
MPRSRSSVRMAWLTPSQPLKFSVCSSGLSCSAAWNLLTQPGLPQDLPKKVAAAQTFVAQIDAAMVSTVRASVSERDKRKGKR